MNLQKRQRFNERALKGKVLLTEITESPVLTEDRISRKAFIGRSKLIFECVVNTD